MASAVYYPAPLHKQKAFAEVGETPTALTNSERLCGEVLTLPVHPYLSDADVDYVVAQLMDAVEAVR